MKKIILILFLIVSVYSLITINYCLINDKKDNCIRLYIPISKLYDPKPIIISKPITLLIENIFCNLFVHLTLVQLMNVIIT